jgi:hypothetical protein
MFKTILFELKSLIQNLKRNFLHPTLDFGPVILAAHPTFFSMFSLHVGPSGIRPTRPLRAMVHLVPFFLLRSLAPPPPVRPAAAVVCRAPPVHHEKPSRCTVPPPSLIKPNPVESPPPPLKSPPLPPGLYKRAPHPRPSSPHSFSLSSPHPRAPSTSSLSLLRRWLPLPMPGRRSPSTNSCHPG